MPIYKFRFFNNFRNFRIESALINDFNIIVIKDAHTTTDRPYFKAKQVIDHYNWIWSEMTPTNGKINVVEYETYLKKAEKN